MEAIAIYGPDKVTALAREQVVLNGRQPIQRIEGPIDGGHYHRDLPINPNSHEIFNPGGGQFFAVLLFV